MQTPACLGLQALIGLVLLSPVYAADAFSPNCAKPQFPGGEARIDSLCGLNGYSVSVARAQAQLQENAVKNNFCVVGKPKAMTISEMVRLQQQASKIVKSVVREPLPNRAVVEKLGEGSLVSLQGYVLIAKQEGAESTNCGLSVPNNPEFHDIHIAIVDKPGNQDECSAVVVEMSPHHRPQSWNPILLRRVAEKQLPVRVTGQLFYDSVHAPCTGGVRTGSSPKRASVWEIHPVYTFEVCPSGTCSQGGWWTLENYAAQ